MKKGEGEMGGVIIVHGNIVWSMWGWGGKGIILEGSFEIILFADCIVLGRGSQGCYCLLVKNDLSI